MRSRLLALCCAPAMLVATLAAALFAAQVSYACSMTGRRQSHCCCAAETARGADNAGARVAPPCCERTIERDQAPAAVQHRETMPPIAWAPGALLAVVTAPLARDPQHVLPANVARGPPGAPRLYARTCRYLI